MNKQCVLIAAAGSGVAAQRLDNNFCYISNIINIFLPFLMSGVVKLPAVVVLLSVFLFGAIFGIWGVFFAVPIASFIKSLMDNWKYVDS